MTPTGLRSTGQVFCSMPLSLELSGAFLMIRIGFEGRIAQRQSAVFTIAYEEYILFIAIDVELDYLAEALFFRFLHC